MRAITYFFLLIIVIIAIGMILFWLNVRLKDFFKIKITYWLVILYTFILVAASVTVPFFSNKVINIEAEEPQKQENIYNELVEKMENGHIEAIDKKYVLTEASYTGLNGDTLKLSSPPEAWFHVFVERKEANDGAIEAFIIYEPCIIDGTDFTKILEPHEIKLSGQTLTIRPKQQHSTLSIMHSPLPVRQLTNTSMMRYSSRSGDQFIYLRIPHDLRLTASDNFYLSNVK